MTGLDFLLQVACSSAALPFVLFDGDGQILAKNRAASVGTEPETLADLFGAHRTAPASHGRSENNHLGADGRTELLGDRAALFVPRGDPNAEDTLRVLRWFIRRCHDAGEDAVNAVEALLQSSSFQPSGAPAGVMHLLRLLFQTSQLLGYIGERDEPIYETKSVSGIFRDYAPMAAQLLYGSNKRLVVDPTFDNGMIYLCRFEQMRTTLSCLISTAMAMADGDAHMTFDSSEFAVCAALNFPCHNPPASLDPLLALPSPEDPRDLSLPIIGEAIRTYGGSLDLRRDGGDVELTLTLHPRIYSAGDAFFLRGASELAPPSSVQLAIELGDLLA